MALTKTATLIGTVNGANRTFSTTVSMASVDYVVYDGSAHRLADVDGFSVNLATGVFTFNYAPQVTDYQPYVQYTDTSASTLPAGVVTAEVINAGTAGGRIELVKGQTYTLEVAFVDATGAPVDLTGATVYFTVKSQYSDSVAALLSKSSATSAIAIQSPASNGIAWVNFAPIDTEAPHPGNYVSDCWLVSATGAQLPAFKLPFELLGRATVL